MERYSFEDAYYAFVPQIVQITFSVKSWLKKAEEYAEEDVFYSLCVIHALCAAQNEMCNRKRNHYTRFVSNVYDISKMKIG